MKANLKSLDPFCRQSLSVIALSLGMRGRRQAPRVEVSWPRRMRMETAKLAQVLVRPRACLAGAAATARRRPPAHHQRPPALVARVARLWWSGSAFWGGGGSQRTPCSRRPSPAPSWATLPLACTALQHTAVRRERHTQRPHHVFWGTIHPQRLRLSARHARLTARRTPRQPDGRRRGARHRLRPRRERRGAAGAAGACGHIRGEPGPRRAPLRRGQQAICGDTGTALRVRSRARRTSARDWRAARGDATCQCQSGRDEGAGRRQGY